MQFINAAVPMSYYRSFRRTFRDDDDNDASVDIDRRRDDDRVRGVWAWRTIAYIQTTVWGIGFSLFTLSYFGQWLRNTCRFYIEHIISNLNYVSYLTGVILLLSSVDDRDIWVYTELVLYILIFPLFVYFIELVMGVRAL